MDIWRIPPSSTLQRYPWCGNNTQVSVAVAGRRYGPISNLHGNVPVIRWEQQSTHVLQPSSLKLDLYIRNVSRPCQNCADFIMSVHSFASTYQTRLIYIMIISVWVITEKNYLSQNLRPFLSIVGKVPEAVTQIMFTHMLEWHWNMTKNIQTSNWVS